jgi:hypothetical protein
MKRGRRGVKKRSVFFTWANSYKNQMRCKFSISFDFYQFDKRNRNLLSCIVLKVQKDEIGLEE